MFHTFYISENNPSSPELDFFLDGLDKHAVLHFILVPQNCLFIVHVTTDYHEYTEITSKLSLYCINFFGDVFAKTSDSVTRLFDDYTKYLKSIYIRYNVFTPPHHKE